MIQQQDIETTEGAWEKIAEEIQHKNKVIGDKRVKQKESLSSRLFAS